MAAMTSLADVNCGCVLLDLWLSLFVGMGRRGQSLLLSSVLMMLIRQQFDTADWLHSLALIDA